MAEKKTDENEVIKTASDIKIPQGPPTIKNRRGDIKKNFWDKLTPEQREAHIEKVRMGAKERAQKKRLMKEQLKTLLTLPVRDKKAVAVLDSLGLDMGDIDNQMLMLVVMWQQVIKGRANCVPAFNALVNVLGEAANNMDLNANLNMVFKNDLGTTDNPIPINEELEDGRDYSKSE